MSYIIQSNKERKSRLDEGLVERLNKTYIKPAEVIPSETDESNRPSLRMIFREIIVITSTQVEYDNLMQICEVAGLNWNSLKATEVNMFEKYGSETSINLDEMLCADKKYYESQSKFDRHKKYSMNIFLTEYNLKDDLKDINEWFNKNKPDRKSKG